VPPAQPSSRPPDGRSPGRQGGGASAGRRTSGRSPGGGGAGERPGAPPPSRKQARRDALFVLYQREVTGEPVEVLLAKLHTREGYEPDPFTVAVAKGVAASVASLDETLEGYSHDWPLSRMAAIERSALRLGLYELLQATAPPEVVVDEAVRLVRRYASDEGGALVNGILGAVLDDLQAREEREEGRGKGH
jgi:N utilization substance protein B